jgi:adenylate cyclase
LFAFTWKLGQLLNVERASLFLVDRKSGFRTRSILCLPIQNRFGAVFAVTQLLNRKDGQPFAEEDERRFKEFTESVGVILETLEGLAVR